MGFIFSVTLSPLPNHTPIFLTLGTYLTSVIFQGFKDGSLLPLLKSISCMLELGWGLCPEGAFADRLLDGLLQTSCDFPQEDGEREFPLGSPFSLHELL